MSNVFRTKSIDDLEQYGRKWSRSYQFSPVCRVWHVHTRDIFPMKILHTGYIWVWPCKWIKGCGPGSDVARIINIYLFRVGLIGSFKLINTNH